MPRDIEKPRHKPQEGGYGSPCEVCGSLVTRSELSAEINGKVYHGRCYGSVMDDAGTPFQCAICGEMRPTIALSNHHVPQLKNLTVWTCRECIVKHKLAGDILIAPMAVN